MRKYGIEHFHLSLLEETDNPNERECYWIELLGSFKNGYNATVGGDGKKYLDYDLIISTYNEVKNCKEVARILNISVDSVYKILHQKSIHIITCQEVNKLLLQKIVGMYDLKTKQLLKSFASLKDASKYLVDNNITKAKDLRGITSHITHVCTNKRKSAYGYFWKYL